MTEQVQRAGERLILVIDEGTTSTRAVLYAADGAVRGMAQADLTQHYPAPSQVEHDPGEIWERTLACARAMVTKAGGADKVAAIGITNQRETVVAWDRQTGEPITPAIVWQDRRTASRCDELREAGLAGMVQRKTGLQLDPYFSATKMHWIMRHLPQARALGQRLALGTVESWLVFKLTGGLHITDATNASRTMLMPLTGSGWDDDLLAMHDLPRTALPEITDICGHFGDTAPELFGRAIPICAMIGDQQSAMVGQDCLQAGAVKATLGTGAFILAATGETPLHSGNRLLGTVLTQVGGQRTYALEGSIFVAGSLVKWLRDSLGLIAEAAETGPMAAALTDNGGVYILPALAGLGAPHWRAGATGTIWGLTHGSGKAQIVRAGLEAVTHQMHDLQHAFAEDGVAWESLKIDGGMSANDWLAQDFANLLGLPVDRPHDVETTARGAAMVASVGCGWRETLEDATEMLSSYQRFKPLPDPTDREPRLRAWRTLLAATLELEKTTRSRRAET